MILVLIILLMVVFGAATFVLFYSSMYYQRRSKILNKVPLLDVVELEEGGQARIKGRVVPLEETLRSPLANVKCVYYRFIVEAEKKKSEVASNFARRRGAEDDDADIEWETVIDEAKVVPFAVEDDSGLAEVAAKDLDADVHASDRHVTGSLKTCSNEQEKALNQRYPGKKLVYSKKMRYTEITIEKGDSVAVSGEVQVRKGRDPRFIAQDLPVHVSDKTDDRVLQDTLAKAKSNKIFAFVSSACTLAATVWLVVYLATPSKSKSSVADSSTTGSSSTTSSNDRRSVASNNSNNNGDDPLPFLKKKKDQPKNNNNRPGFEQPKGDSFPVVQPPPNFNPPPNFGPPKKEPPKNDFDSLVAEVKKKIDPPDVFGMKDTIERIEKNIPRNHARRAELFKAFAEGSRSENPFIRGDCTTAAAKYAGKEDVPELLAMLREKRNVFAEGEIFKSLAEIKDPATAEQMAELLNTHADGAAKVLRAIGTPAEKFVQVVATRQPGENAVARIFARKKAIEILGDIGTQSSIDLMSPWIPVFDEFHVKREVQEAIKKIVKRNQ